MEIPYLEPNAEHVAQTLQRALLASEKFGIDCGLCANEIKKIKKIGGELPDLCELYFPNFSQLTLCHGDFHYGNVLEVPGRELIIDWECAAIGPYFWDLIWLSDSERSRYLRFSSDGLKLSDKSFHRVIAVAAIYRMLEALSTLVVRSLISSEFRWKTFVSSVGRAIDMEYERAR